MATATEPKMVSMATSQNSDPTSKRIPICEHRDHTNMPAGVPPCGGLWL